MKGGSELLRFDCPVAGCSRSYKTSGWLRRHINSNHGLAVPNDPITPPSAVVADVGATPVVAGRAPLLLVGQSPDALQIPVSSPGDGGADHRDSRQSGILGDRGGI